MGTYDFKKEFRELYQPGEKPAVVDVPRMIFAVVEGEGDPNTAPAYAEAIETLYGISYGIKMSKMSKDLGLVPEGYFEYVVPPLEGLWWTDGAIFDGVHEKDKSRFRWVAMIRQPPFVTPVVFARACAGVAKKKPELDLSRTRLVHYHEGLCAQVMHRGPYDAEPVTVAKLNAFVDEGDYRPDFTDSARIHDDFCDVRPTPRDAESELHGGESAEPCDAADASCDEAQAVDAKSRIAADEEMKLSVFAHQVGTLDGRCHHEIYLGDPRRVAPEKLRTVIRHPIAKEERI